MTGPQLNPQEFMPTQGDPVAEAMMHLEMAMSILESVKGGEVETETPNEMDMASMMGAGGPGGAPAPDLVPAPSVA